jgi:hypothetical protein
MPSQEPNADSFLSCNNQLERGDAARNFTAANSRHDKGRSGRSKGVRQGLANEHLTREHCLHCS